MDSFEMLAFSGIRPGEASAVMGMLEQCGLPVEDITPPCRPPVNSKPFALIPLSA